MTGRIGEPNAAHGFLDTDRNFQQPQPQGRELRLGQIADRRDGVADGEQEPVGSRVKDEPDLVGDRLSARCAVRGEMGLVRLNQVLGLAAGAVEGLVDDTRARSREVGDDEANVEPEFGRFDARDGPALARPATSRARKPRRPSRRSAPTKAAHRDGARPPGRSRWPIAFGKCCELLKELHDLYGWRVPLRPGRSRR